MELDDLVFWDNLWGKYYAVRGRPNGTPWHPIMNELPSSPNYASPTGLLSPKSRDGVDGDMAYLSAKIGPAALAGINERLQEFKNTHSNLDYRGSRDRTQGAVPASSYASRNGEHHTFGIIERSEGLSSYAVEHPETFARSLTQDYERGSPSPTPPPFAGNGGLRRDAATERVEDYGQGFWSRPTASPSPFEDPSDPRPWVPTTPSPPPSPFLPTAEYPSDFPYHDQRWGAGSPMAPSPAASPRTADYAFMQGLTAPTLEYLPPPLFPIGEHPKSYPDPLKRPSDSESSPRKRQRMFTDTLDSIFVTPHWRNWRGIQEETHPSSKYFDGDENYHADVETCRSTSPLFSGHESGPNVKGPALVVPHVPVQTEIEHPVPVHGIRPSLGRMCQQVYGTRPSLGGKCQVMRGAPFTEASDVSYAESSAGEDTSSTSKREVGGGRAFSPDPHHSTYELSPKPSHRHQEESISTPATTLEWGPPRASRPDTRYEDISAGGDTPMIYQEDLEPGVCYSPTDHPRKYERVAQPSHGFLDPRLMTPGYYSSDDDNGPNAQWSPRFQDVTPDATDRPRASTPFPARQAPDNINDALGSDSDVEDVTGWGPTSPSDYGDHPWEPPITPGSPTPASSVSPTAKKTRNEYAAHLGKVAPHSVEPPSPLFLSREDSRPLKRSSDSDFPQGKRQKTSTNTTDITFNFRSDIVSWNVSEDQTGKLNLTVTTSGEEKKLSVEVWRGPSRARKPSLAGRNRATPPLFSLEDIMSSPQMSPSDVRDGVESNDQPRMNNESHWRSPDAEIPTPIRNGQNKEPADSYMHGHDNELQYQTHRSSEEDHRSLHTESESQGQSTTSGFQEPFEAIAKKSSTMSNREPQIVLPKLSAKKRGQYVEYVEHNEKPTRILRQPHSVKSASSQKKTGKHVTFEKVENCDRVTRSTPNKEATFVKLNHNGKRAQPWDEREEASEELPRKKARNSSTSGRLPKPRTLSQVSKGLKRSRRA